MATHLSHGSKPGDRLHYAATGIAFLACGWWIFDFVFPRTFLITPIPSLTRWAGGLVGACAGLAIGLIVALRQSRKPKPADPTLDAGSFVFMLCLLAPILGATIAIKALWRIENLVEFHGSDTPIAVTPFQIVAYRSGRGGPKAEIASLGESPAIAISRQDYRFLRDNRGIAFCLPLRSQRAGRIVRVWYPPRMAGSFEGTTVVRCPWPVA